MWTPSVTAMDPNSLTLLWLLVTFLRNSADALNVRGYMNDSRPSTLQSAAATSTCNPIGYHNVWADKFEEFETRADELASMYNDRSPDFQQMSSMWQTMLEIYVTTLVMQGFAGGEYAAMTDTVVGSSCLSQYGSYVDSFICASSPGNFDYPATPPCCGRCTVVGGPVQLFYWPTSQSDSPMSTFSSNGFIFTSPSVYLAFETVFARDVCGTLGQEFNHITLPFDAKDISSDGLPLTWARTDPIMGIGTAKWTKVDFEDLNRECVSSFCAPRISIPSQVSQLDLAWSTCQENFAGFYDPPVALRPVAGLEISKAQDNVVTKPVSVPASSIQSASPKATLKPQQPTPTPLLTIPPSQSTHQGQGPQPAKSHEQVNSPNEQTVASTSRQDRSSKQLSPDPPYDTALPNIQRPTPSPGVKSIENPAMYSTSSGFPPQSAHGNPNNLTPNLLTPSITIAGYTILIDNPSSYLVDGKTLVPGGPVIVVSGTSISLDPSATAMVLGESTYSVSGPYISPTQAGSDGSALASTGGLGAIIMSAFGGAPGPASASATLDSGSGTGNRSGDGYTGPVYTGGAMGSDRVGDFHSWGRLLLSSAISAIVPLFGL